MNGMIWIDYSILGLIFISLFIGLIRGFIKEAFSLLTWIIAVWAGLMFSRELSVYFASAISYPSARIALAFAALFFATLIIGAIVAYLLGELVKKTGLTGSDRFAGMIFGIARGVLVVAILVLLAGLTPLPEDPWWKESKLIPPFQSLALWLRDHMPAGLTDYIQYR